MKLSAPLANVKLAASVPPRLSVVVAPSGSDASYCPTFAVEFSGKFTRADPVITGASFTFWTVTVTFRSVLPVASEALTVTSYTPSPSASSGRSKSSAALVDSAIVKNFFLPVTHGCSMKNRPASAPAREKVIGSPSGSSTPKVPRLIASAP